MEQSEDYDDTSTDWAFNFESDHLALRGNREYSMILRTIALLSAQKIQIHKDIEEIIQHKNKYLHDPSGFVNDIFEDKFVSPAYRCIAEIQDIGSTKTENYNDNDMEAKLNTDIKVRGRIFDQSKPETFNQLWTCDEQRRLEQLLIEYPVEPIEMRRFAKIAHALGNRTPQQVASRVQKFFKKLHSVGMPIPGRLPKNKKSVFSAKSKHFYKNLYRQSTFFPAHNVPVNMPDDEFTSEDPYGSNSFNYQKSLTTTTTAVEKENMLRILQEIRKEKVSPTLEDVKNPTEKCENCLEAISMESRWICNTCCYCINLCGDCIVQQLINKTFMHISHELVLNKEMV
ncbi:ZZ-type zinc finger-containing protein 3 [Episyrphus balteatus]|uniref:ZZ-type zinc finger-containing protein 3 n=1 Tax=Episyrphus balteatus TaxID=286459 RepID=UPI002485D779|nr:ZZ-type zinc finger-containing protein 3 [Episyrphus balteatus]XP_055843743.1 ZZ-type zinc finger-containing protein 3 [Episyrphus balteatus]